MRESRLKWLVAASCILISCYIMVLGMQHSAIISNNAMSSIGRMIDGSAERPFIYRTLLPQLTNGIAYITPKAVEDAITLAVVNGCHGEVDGDLYSERLLPHIGLKMLCSNPTSIYTTLIMLTLMMATLLGYTYMLYVLAKYFFPTDRLAIYIAPVLGLLILPPFVVSTLKLYDFPVLFFAALLMWLLIRQQFALYFPVFALACFNKESAVILVLLFVLWLRDTMPRKQLVILVIVQLVIFVAIKLLVNKLFAGSVGSVLYFPLWENILKQFDKIDYYDLTSRVVLVLMLAGYWQSKPHKLKVALWLLVPYTLAYVTVGITGEYRVFFDAFPLLALLTAHTMARFIQAKG